MQPQVAKIDNNDWFKFTFNFCILFSEVTRMNIGNKIIALRTEKKMSQSELAELLDVSRQTISKWECNICDPEIGRIKQMAIIFNVTTDYLLDNNIDNDVLNVKQKTNIIKNSLLKFKILSVKTKIAIAAWFITIGFIIYTIVYAYVINPFTYNKDNGPLYKGLSSQIHAFIDGTDISSTGFILIIISCCLIILTLIYSLLLIINKRSKKDD